MALPFRLHALGGWLNLPAVRRALKAALIVFISSRLVILIALVVAEVVIPEGFDPKDPDLFVHTDAPWPVDALIRWDGAHYLSIARDGYSSGSHPTVNTARFWPLYPFLVHVAGAWAGEQGLIYAGLLISSLAFLASLFLLYRLVERDLDARIAERCLWYLAVFPGAFFFTAYYAESLLLLLSVLFFHALRDRRWLLASMLGGMAAATRAPGVILGAPYLWECFRVAGWSPARGWRPFLLGAFIPAGLLLYVAAVWLQVGNPLAITSSYQLWGTVGQFEDTGRYYALDAFISEGGSIRFGGAWIGAISSLTFIAATVWLARHRFLDYALFAAMTLVFHLSLAVPAGTGSMVRYLVPIFPVFIAFAIWGSTWKWFHYSYLLYCLVLLFFAAMLYSRWYWVG